MLFNSFTFLYFLAVVYPLYAALPRRAQNVWLVAASLFFYGWWDWRFVGLLLATMAVDFGAAIAIEGARSERGRRAWLAASLGANLGVLGFFKYFDFFAGVLTGARPLLQIVLPLGISFYTFQAMSYVIDVYRRRLPACRDVVDYVLFITYFPQLVAGPLVRAGHFLPQARAERVVTAADVREATWLVLYGFFMKTVVADNLVPVVKPLAGNVAGMEPGALWLALYATTFLIFADFCGYSSIARGLGKLMGFDLPHNFRRPFFARNPADFWRRWHVSLSDWFRDYVFQPLSQIAGKARGRDSAWLALCAFVTLVLCGLWHGAAWNFIAFGAFHGALLVGYYALRKPMRRLRRDAGPLRLPARVLGTVLAFHVLSLGAVLFMLPGPGEWALLVRRLATEMPRLGAPSPEWQTLLIFGGILLAAEALQEATDDQLAVLRAPAWARLAVFVALFALIVLCGATGTHEFIYFQF